MDKRSQRRALFGRIRALSKEEKAEHSARIRALLEDHPAISPENTILAFLPLKSEPDLTPLCFPDSTGRTTRWGFARIDGDGHLSFLLAESVAECLRSDFGLLEPDPRRCRPVDEENVRLVLVPGVGFDPHTGARLGRGRGHYDRFLARLLDLPNPPEFVGIAFSEQLGPLDPEDHDVPMHAVVTERGWLRPAST